MYDPILEDNQDEFATLKTQYDKQQKKNTDAKREIKDSDVSNMYIKSEVRLSDKIPHPPTAISMGRYKFKDKFYDIPFGSYGDFSCIVGASKSKKTFFKSALVAAYLAGDFNSHFPNIKGVDNAGKWVIEIDTEQSRYHAQRVFKRVSEITGINPDKYAAFSLREYDSSMRMKFVNSLISNPKFEGNIGLIIIDGFADLINDINSLDEANELTQNLLRWSTLASCHIIGVLHSSFGSRKPTGHIGSAVMKKAETVAVLSEGSEPELVRVKCDYSRNMPFNDFEFYVDENFLPKAANIV